MTARQLLDRDQALRALLDVLGFRLSRRFDGCTILRLHRVYGVPKVVA